MPAKPAADRNLARKIANAYAGGVTITADEFRGLKERVRALLNTHKEQAARKEAQRLKQVNLHMQADLA